MLLKSYVRHIQDEVNTYLIYSYINFEKLYHYSDHSMYLFIFLVTITSGESLSTNNSYISIPSGISSGSHHYTVCPCSDDICRIKFDFTVIRITWKYIEKCLKSQEHIYAMFLRHFVILLVFHTRGANHWPRNSSNSRYRCTKWSIFCRWNMHDRYLRICNYSNWLIFTIFDKIQLSKSLRFSNSF